MRRPQRARPCGSCPFRRESLAGWLGGNTPEGMAYGLFMREEELPCHESIDYDDPRWLAKWRRGETGRRCVGSLVMLQNAAKLPRDRDYADAVRAVEADEDAVFSRISEFIDHHQSAPIKSWEREVRGVPVPPEEEEE